MSCSLRQVLRLQRADSPPTPSSLMRKLIQKLWISFATQEGWWKEIELNHLRALRREIWCCPADSKMLYVPARSVTNDCALHTVNPKGQDCFKGNQSVQCSARCTYWLPLTQLKEPISTQNPIYAVPSSAATETRPYSWWWLLLLL